MTYYRNVLVIGQGFDTVHIDSECLVASQDFVEALHQLLLLSSHISFLFIEKQDHETILILTHWDAAIAHRLGNTRHRGLPFDEIQRHLTTLSTTLMND